MSDFIIENGVLRKCRRAAKEVVIPEGVTGIGDSAFWNCSSLTSIVLPEGVTSIGRGAFCNCSSLTGIVIPEGVTSIGESAFLNCSSLTGIVIPEGVTSIGDRAFVNCSSLKSIVIPEGVTSIGDSAFCNCSSLTGIVIPEGVTIIGQDAFYNCSSLTGIVIPEGVTSIGRYAFRYCSSLTNIIIPESVKEIGGHAFSGTPWLREQGDIAVVNGILIAYQGKKSVVNIPEGVTGIGAWAFSGCRRLKSIDIPESVTSIGNYAFAFCSRLASIVIPASVTEIGDSSFEGCENLTQITTKVKLTSKMFGETKITKPITTNDIGNLPNNMKPFAAVGFAENPDDVKSARGKSHVKYIKSNAAKLVDFALEYPCLLQFMIENKLLTPEIAEMYFNSAQAAGKTEAVAMLLDYQQHKLTAGEKQKAAEKAEAREEKITEFIFDTENLEQLQGKVFVVTGKLKTFVSRDEFKACLDACGAVLSETLNEKTGYLITNTPDSGSAKNKKAEQLGIKKLTEEEFNRLIGRAQQ